jgi:hypothetical protein
MMEFALFVVLSVLFLHFFQNTLSVTGAVMIFLISCKTPTWIGVYWSNKQHDYGEPVGASSKHLTFNVQWSIRRHFAQVYCVTLLFFCGAPPIKIPLSAMIGIVVGFLIFYYFVYLGRTTNFENKKTEVAIFMASLISIASSAAFSSGCWYIQRVWGREEKQVLGVSSFLSWLAGAALVHFVMFRNTLRKEAAAAVMPPDQRVSRNYKTRHFKPSQIKQLQKQIMIEESNLEETKELEKMDKEDENGDQAKANNGGNDDIVDITLEEVDEDLEAPRIIDTTGGGNTDDEEAEREEGQYETWLIFTLLARLHCCGNADETTLEKIVTVVESFFVFLWAVPSFCSWSLSTLAQPINIKPRKRSCQGRLNSCIRQIIVVVPLVHGTTEVLTQQILLLPLSLQRQPSRPILVLCTVELVPRDPIGMI